MYNFFEPEIFLNIYLNSIDKLIFLLLKEKDFCNKDLEILCSSSQPTISKSIYLLCNFKYIDVKIIKGVERKISINKKYKIIYKPLLDLYTKCGKENYFSNKIEINHILSKIIKNNNININNCDKDKFLDVSNQHKNTKVKENITKKPKNFNKNNSFDFLKPQKRVLDSIKNSLDREVENKKAKKIKAGNITLTKDEREIIDHWYNLGLSKYDEKRKVNKSFNEMSRTLRRILKGAFYKDINDFKNLNFTPSIDDIKLSMDKFALAALNPNYKPIGEFKEFMRKCNLGTFLFNVYGSTEETRSFFLHYLSHEPEYVQGIQYETYLQAIQRWKNYNVIITNIKPEDMITNKKKLLKFYGENYLRKILKKYKEFARIYGKSDFKVEEQTCFIRAVENMVDYIIQNNQKFLWKAWWFFGTVWESFPNKLVEAAYQNMFSDQKWEPKIFLDNTLYNWKFEKYIRTLGWIQEKNSFKQEVEQNYGIGKTISLKNLNEGKEPEITMIKPKYVKDPTKDFL